MRSKARYKMRGKAKHKDERQGERGTKMRGTEKATGRDGMVSR